MSVPQFAVSPRTSEALNIISQQERGEYSSNDRAVAKKESDISIP